MSRCDECGKQENMPYHCRHCGGTYCADHRLPENHSCPGLENWNDPDGVFDSGFDDSVDTSSSGGGTDQSVSQRLGIDTGPGSAMAYFRGNVTYLFLGVMWIVFLLQHIVISVAGLQAHNALFVLSSTHPEFVWTWVTSVFSHQPGSLLHIGFNSIVIFFFGRVTEDYIGSRDFAILFVVSGAIAGLGHVALSIAQGNVGGVLGASGAAAAVMGVLTLLNPNLRVLIWGVIPAPIWALTAFFVLYNTFGASGAIGGNTAYVAHLLGLAIGLAYGQHVKSKIRTPQRLRFGGGGGGGPGGPGGPGGGRRRGPF